MAAIGYITLAFFAGAVTGIITMCLVQYKNMRTKLQIISRLWSHIADLRLILKGTSSKTLEEVENEIDITESLCRPYADADDEEVFK